MYSFRDLNKLCPYDLYKVDEHTAEQLRNMLIILGNYMDDDSPVGANDEFRIFAYIRNGVVTISDFDVLEKNKGRIKQ